MKANSAKYFDDFKRNSLSCKDFYGDADLSQIEASIGAIVINFSEFEDIIAVVVIKLIGTGLDKGKILTANLPFKAKLELLNSLATLQIETTGVLFGLDDSKERLKQLVALCEKASALRNEVIHSSWEVVTFKDESGVWGRRKSTKSKMGYNEKIERFDLAELRDIADYIFYASVKLMEVFDLDFDVVDKIHFSGAGLD